MRRVLRILSQVAILIVVVPAAHVAAWLGIGIEESAGIRALPRGDFGALGAMWCLIFWLGLWSILIGLLAAWLWHRRLRWRRLPALALAGVAFILVLTPSLILLDWLPWAPVGLLAKVAALALSAFFPSQVTFWGFMLVFRMGAGRAFRPGTKGSSRAFSPLQDDP